MNANSSQPHFFFLSLFLPVSLCAFQVHLTNRMNTLYTAHITFTFLILTSIMYTFVYSKKKLCSSEVFLSFLTVTTFPTAKHIKLTCRMLYCWYLTQFLRQQALFCTYILTCNKQSNALFYQQTWNKVRILNTMLVPVNTPVLLPRILIQEYRQKTPYTDDKVLIYSCCKT